MTSELPDDYGPDLAWDAGEIEPSPGALRSARKRPAGWTPRMPSSLSTGPA